LGTLLAAEIVSVGDGDPTRHSPESKHFYQKLQIDLHKVF